jgi:catabolite regulation protein CreA
MHLFLFVALICAACQPILGFELKLQTFARFVQRCLPATLASIVLIGQVDPAFASREVGNIPATGFVFKDYLKINAFSDPKVKGVELYVADFERPLTEKLGKDFFDDPSSSSLACAQVGPVVVAKDMSTSPEGEEVFEESRNLFFKVGCLH